MHSHPSFHSTQPLPWLVVTKAADAPPSTVPAHVAKQCTDGQPHKGDRFMRYRGPGTLVTSAGLPPRRPRLPQLYAANREALNGGHQLRAGKMSAHA